MKLPARLAKSRHGIFYFRFVYREQDKIREKRFSLDTRDPSIARHKATMFSAIVAKHKMILELRESLKGTHRELLVMATQYDPRKFDPNDPSTWPTDADIDELKVTLPDGTVIESEPGNAKDLEDLGSLLQRMNIPLPVVPLFVENGPLMPTQGGAGSASRPVGEPSLKRNGAIAKVDPKRTIQFIHESYHEMNKVNPTVSSKTLYEYGQNQQKFMEWLRKERKQSTTPIAAITREVIGDFIHYLLIDCKIARKTIQHKYLSAISALLELGQKRGYIAAGELASRGHKVYSKSTKGVVNGVLKQAVNEVESRRPFTTDELITVFDATGFAKWVKPCDFWLPLLGLFTGARISELTQLHVTDVQYIEEIGHYVLNINEDDDKKVKTASSIRLVPVHKIIIDLGFLNYLEDAKKFGEMIFPYLIDDAFGSYAGTPSERFSRYLKNIGVKTDTTVFHSFRSTLNTRLAQRNYTVANDVLGHRLDAQLAAKGMLGMKMGSINSEYYRGVATLKTITDVMNSAPLYEELKIEELIFDKQRALKFLPKGMRHKADILAKRLEKIEVEKEKEKPKVGRPVKLLTKSKK